MFLKVSNDGDSIASVSVLLLHHVHFHCSNLEFLLEQPGPLPLILRLCASERDRSPLYAVTPSVVKDSR